MKRAISVFSVTAVAAVAAWLAWPAHPPEAPPPRLRVPQRMVEWSEAALGRLDPYSPAQGGDV